MRSMTLASGLSVLLTFHRTGKYTQTSMVLNAFASPVREGYSLQQYPRVQAC